MSSFLGREFYRSTLYLINNLVDKRGHTFPKSISVKVNVIARLKFELTYYNVAVRHFSYYSTRTPSFYNSNNKNNNKKKNNNNNNNGNKNKKTEEQEQEHSKKK